MGFEPTHPKGPDLQSGAALQLDRPPKYISSSRRSLFKPAYLTHLVSGLRPAGYANSLRDNINCALPYICLTSVLATYRFNFLPGRKLNRLDTSRRILKTGPVQAPGPWKLDTSREDFRCSFEQQTPCGVVRDLGLKPRSLFRRRILSNQKK